MADVKFEVVEFDTPTTAATNTQDITISGFGTPSAAIFIYSYATADDTPLAQASMSIGWTDGTNQGAVAVSSQNGGGTSNTARSQSDTDVIVQINPDGSTEDAAFGFSAWTTDGVTIVVNNQDTTARKCTCILIGGADVANAFVGFKDDLGTGTGAVNITGVGFESDLVFMTCTGSATAPVAQNAAAILSFGVGHNGGGTQRASLFGEEDGVGGSTNVNSYIGNTVITGQQYTSLSWTGVIEDYDADGFSVNTSASAGTDIVFYLCLKFNNSPDIKLFDMEWPTAGNYAETSPAFTPNFGMICSVSGPTARNTSTTTDTGFSLSAFDAANTNSMSYTTRDGVATNLTRSYHNAAAVKLLDGDGSTTAVTAGTPTFDSSGWDFTLTTNPVTNPVLGWGLAIGAGGGSILPQIMYNRQQRAG